MPERKKKNRDCFQERLGRHHDELRWLYMELYNHGDMFGELCDTMQSFYKERSDSLKELDGKREESPDWFRKNDMLGMMLYIDNFAGDLKGVREHIDYLQSCNVSCIHLMPFLDSPKGRSDGGYAVADFRKVRPELGSMADLQKLSRECHRRCISLCMDFVMNHTSEEHEWAKRARNGEGEYMSRYFFFDNYDIPAQYEKTVPQVFPTTAPGNFTWIPEAGHHVMTTFYPYQWDLNYKNPRVFNEMMYNFLFLANQGMDVIRIDAVPYIWKEIGTSCRNLRQVHSIVRMMRMISEVVCPGVILLGEVVMEPEKVAPYFGTVEKPECHMLYNVTTMATIWNSVATRDVRLLKKQMDIVNRLPREYTFLNYLRCHDDIGWGLDYPTLKEWGMEEVPHKKFLNQFFTGRIGGSISRGELYNEDLATGDARFCGTTASMCGIESAGFEQDQEKMKGAIALDIMLHAYILAQSGIPMLYSGDEIGQVNDYTYKEDMEKREDSRYIHRGKFPWKLTENIGDPDTVQGKLFPALSALERLRREEPVFAGDARVWTVETGNCSVLGIGRRMGDELLIALFNFHEMTQEIELSAEEALTGERFQNLLTGEALDLAKPVVLCGHRFLWAKKVCR